LKRANEALVGAVVLVAFAAVAAGSVWLSQRRFGADDRVVEARFRSIGGLQQGRPVVLQGVRVGRVEAISLGPGGWVHVSLRLRGDVAVPAQPIAIISSTTLFGDWGVDIRTAEGLPDDPEVRRQVAEARGAGPERWPGASLPDIGQLTAQAGRIAGDIALIASRVTDAFDSTSAARLRNAFLDLSNLSRRMNQIVTRQQEALTRIGDNLDTGTASLRRSAAALERTLRRADSSTNREQLQRILGHTDTVAADLRAITSDLRGVAGAAASQSASIERAIRNTDSILARVEAGSGTLGRLVNDTTLYAEALETVKSLRSMLQDMRQNPRRYFSFSVF
jgi:phospholipid/cholesterol/gamma-HCH transport system substrate-binding protein